MSKAYKVDRTNGDVALENDSVVTIYDSIDDAELDINNIEEGQIIGTKDTIDSSAIEEEIKADLDEYAETLMQSYGQPVGSYLAMEDNSVIPQGYLLADGRDTTGTADELSTNYPLLYAYLGNTNVLPDIGDKLDYGNAEALTYNSNTANEAATVNQQDMTFTMTRSGLIILNVTGYNGACGYIQVNGKVIDKMSSHASNWLNVSTVSVPVQKGDVVNVHLSYTANYTWYNYQTFIPYKTHKYIKAVSGIETGSTEAQEVTNAVNTIEAFVSNAEVYSTTEVKTNKTWIDGKPIYRKVVTATAGAGPSAWGWAISQTDFNNIGIENITFAGVVADNLQFMPIAVHKSNGFYPMVGMITVGQRIVLEYTKS